MACFSHASVQLPLCFTMAYDRFFWMLRLHCRNLTGGFPPCPTITRSLPHPARLSASEGEPARISVLPPSVSGTF